MVLVNVILSNTCSNNKTNKFHLRATKYAIHPTNSSWSANILILVDGRNWSGGVGRGRQVAVAQCVGGDLEDGHHEHQEHADDGEDGSRAPGELVLISNAILNFSVATSLEIINNQNEKSSSRRNK